jgi:hypothetical protein
MSLDFSSNEGRLDWSEARQSCFVVRYVRAVVRASWTSVSCGVRERAWVRRERRVIVLMGSRRM